MAYATIDRPSNNFRIKLYTGNGSTQSITFDESTAMQPDWTWIKVRNDANVTLVHDVIRGATKEIYTPLANAEATDANGLTAFNSNGFSVGSANGVNRNGYNFVNWSWKANGSGVSNTSGTISSTVSANQTAGFSIVSYTGNGTNNATVGHGLGVTPAMLIVKNRDVADGWGVWNKGLGSATQQMQLNGTGAVFTDDVFNAVSSTTVTLGTDTWSNTSTKNYIMYCWSEVKGYSKFGSYTGNGSTDGTFIYTGFKPAFVLIKQSSGAGEFWILSDNKRVADFNVTDARLFPNSQNAESSNGSGNIDFLSNGFKIRNSDAPMNTSSATYIYMCFASSPFVSSKGIPTTAR
jgi:hypothetical protein